MTFDEVKKAWATADRRAELNRVVERLAAARTPREVLDAALGRLLDDVRAAGADDETEEIILGVGDRLHGWCHPSRWVTTTPDPTSR